MKTSLQLPEWPHLRQWLITRWDNHWLIEPTYLQMNRLTDSVFILNEEDVDLVTCRQVEILITYMRHPAYPKSVSNFRVAFNQPRHALEFASVCKCLARGECLRVKNGDEYVAIADCGVGERKIVRLDPDVTKWIDDISDEIIELDSQIG